jgi:hypothetical protein
LLPSLCRLSVLPSQGRDALLYPLGDRYCRKYVVGLGIRLKPWQIGSRSEASFPDSLMECPQGGRCTMLRALKEGRDDARFALCGGSKADCYGQAELTGRLA